MRLAVLADTHGNLPALEAVLADVERQGVDGLIVAGDITGGPHAAETIAALRSLGGFIIRGNGDEYFLDFDAGRAPPAWYTSALWATLRWSYERLDRETLDFVRLLPDQRVLVFDGAAPIRVVHGSPWSTREFLYPDHDRMTLAAFRRAGLMPADGEVPALSEKLAGLVEPVLVCAHSHISWVQDDGDRLSVNPGSVGAPNNGDVRAQYALLTWTGDCWRASLHAVCYDLERVRAAYCDSGLLAAGGAMAEAFLLGILSGENVPGRFVNHVQRLSAEAGFGSGEELPDSVWQEAVSTFGWPPV